MFSLSNFAMTMILDAALGDWVATVFREELKEARVAGDDDVAGELS